MHVYVTQDEFKYYQQLFRFKDKTGIQIVKQLMSENDLTISDIGRIIGNAKYGSRVVNGGYRIGVNMSFKLSDYFKLPHEIFLRERV